MEEYLENALAFEQLAAVEIDPTLKDGFEKQSVACRKLAAERAKRLGLRPSEIQTETPPLKLLVSNVTMLASQAR